ncbi:MAG: hypothetical protein JW751_04260 [Polyangiaceae bacterium]|nr:hypothetical protein [Polyangiaceae bacterium]
MRTFHIAAIAGVMLCVLACSDRGGDSSTPASGGAAGTGGAGVTGGVGVTGGTGTSGGAGTSGGVMAIGGTSPTGGAGQSGGSGGTSTGGLPGGTGGAEPTGGVDSTGGIPGSGATGGDGANPGSGGVGTGGAIPSGGMAGAGATAVAGAAGAASSSYCSSPAGAGFAAAHAYYQVFKDTVVTGDGAQGHLRIWKPDSGSVIGSTVSEGMGYGLLLAVFHDDQATFDELWRYAALYLNGNGLMDWEVHPDGHVIGTGAASDGDEDIAFALVMAHRRWGGRGTLDEDYLTLAVRTIEAMWEHEVDQGRGAMWLPGDAWGGRDITNLSYFAPAYFRVFGEVTDNVAGWNAVIEGNYTILERTLNDALGNTDNGLVPAWSDSQGNLVSAFDGAPTHFQNDSTRTPFRVGQDWCWFGEPRAKAYLDEIAAFYAGVGVANIENGYDLDGTPRPENDFPEQAASFVGPAGVAFMSDPRWQAELDSAWSLVVTGDLMNGTIYYQTSWTALSLLMMSGEMVPDP